MVDSVDDQSLAALWSLLRSRTRVEITARSLADNFRWTGLGTGIVDVTEEGTHTLLFNERGRWNNPSHGNPAFSNIYRWKIAQSGQSIRLEHLRYGESNPVSLVDIIGDGIGSWSSQAPHRCNEDSCGIQIKQCGDTLHMKWTVRGPQKQQLIHINYQ